MTAGVYAKLASVALVGGGLLGSTVAMAAESGKGVYLLGFRSQYAGVLPGPGAFYQNDVYIYSGSAGGSRELIEIGGVVASNVDATAILELPTFSYFTPAFGGLFGVTYTQPMGWQEVSASVTGPQNNTFSLTQDDFLFGDPFVNAFVGWNEGNWHWNISAGVNVPIGQWEESAPGNINLVNLGFNRWAFDVTGSATYLDMTTGLEASAALGFTFNGKNLDLDYKTGTEMHLEWSLTQITASGFSFGVAGYHYQQLTGDSGSDAKLGAFKGQVTAIGPAMGLTVPMADRALTAKFRGYYEFNVENRVEGFAAMGTLAVPLQAATQ
jgi:hypothetical protein